MVTTPGQHAIAAAGCAGEIAIELAGITLLERGIGNAVAARRQFDEVALTVAVLVRLTIQRLPEITLLIECRLHNAITAITG